MAVRNRLKEARKQSRDLTDRNRIEAILVGRAGTDPRSPSFTVGQDCRFGRCAAKAVKFTSGGLHRVPVD